MLGLFALSCVFTVSQFPAEPLTKEFQRGVALARKHRKPGIGDLFQTNTPRNSMDALFQSDRQNVGWWSNGYEQQPIDHVVWLSPPLLSRWIGFLSAQEYWSSDEIVTRWGNIADALVDRRAFVVQLSAFSKIPTYGFGDEVRPNTADIDNVRFVYTSGNDSVEMNAIQLAQWQSRDRFELDRFLWWQVLPFSGALNGEFEAQQPDPPLMLGDNYRSWTLVWVEGVDDLKFEVRILSPRKERVGYFSIPKK